MEARVNDLIEPYICSAFFSPDVVWAMLPKDGPNLLVYGLDDGVVELSLASLWAYNFEMGHLIQMEVAVG